MEINSSVFVRKKCIRSSRIRFVIFLTSGDGNVALSVLFSKKAWCICCCIQYGITPEASPDATYRSSNRNYFDGRKFFA